MFDLPAATASGMRLAARDAGLAAARAFGFGGERWAVQRPSGVGVGARTLVDRPEVRALAFRQAPGPLAPATAGTPVLADVWRLLLVSGELRPGDVIASVAPSGYAFAVADAEPWYDYVRFELTRVR